MGPDQGLTRLFFDGGCGLCSGAARLVARGDREGEIRFAPLGGATFLRCVPESERAGLPDSLVVQTPEGLLLTRTEAVIHLLNRMGPGWRQMGGLLGWTPRLLRDGIYGLAARLRPRRRACARNDLASDKRFEP